MAYNEHLADRIRPLLAHHEGVVEKKMFGGLSFMVNGKMCVGIVKDDFCARVGKAQYAECLKRPFARPMDFTKRPMKGWIFVGPGGVENESDLKAWVADCERFVLSL